MPRTTTPQEICRLLSSGPLTSSQLAEICCCTQRYIRRQLLSLISSGAVAAVQNPADKRGIIYSITTASEAVPLNQKIGEQIGELFPK
ncbi:MAG: hypothetical protein Q4Q53_07185, partial [Methanocorpusculum sp.]|nr:hypothetical protein [Methanocorpusculum sp.]